MEKIKDLIGWNPTHEEHFGYDNGNVPFSIYRRGIVLLMILTVILIAVMVIIPINVPTIVLVAYYLFISAGAVIYDEVETGMYFTSLIFLTLGGLL